MASTGHGLHNADLHGLARHEGVRHIRRLLLPVFESADLILACQFCVVGHIDRLCIQLQDLCDSKLTRLDAAFPFASSS